MGGADGAGLRSPSAWAWQRQVRFYLRGQDVAVEHVKASFEYTFEYQVGWAGRASCSRAARPGWCTRR